MTKKARVITIMMILVCAFAQLAVMANAATSAYYTNVTLPNLQREVQLAAGTNASNNSARTYMTFSGGTANKIYVQTQKSDGSSPITAWCEFSQSNNYQSLWYNTNVKTGTGLKVIAYQKNVLSKTASGHIYF